ncbi:hypothetical protein K466DRAFT_665300 [Polyporus arcularius HHB13444]|uniref:F-box domain-containing protein n=1 Tax=Polyporus arcularius HHB13444 TaxID=1314778 RepID=A0A5C3P414_9APHY|nr:hypothetical protein K466DRAFT_665300 [Polyporus arcularius HHB13444]
MERQVVRGSSYNGETGHIKRLPNELLVQVFHAYDARMEVALHTYAPKNERCYRSHWLPLMLVCRHWRALGVSAPSLWQLIEVGKNKSWVELALLRSGSLPIRLLVTDKYHPSQSLFFLLPHTNRIQKFIHQSALSHELVAPLRCLFDALMPVLDEIEILDPSHPFVAPTFGLPELRIAELSKLRTLRLSFVPISLDANALCKLHCLALEGPVFNDSSVSYSNFLRVLQGCLELKELRLRRLLSRLPNRTPPDHAITLNLPKLRKLVIWDLPSVTSSFLAGMHLSPEVTLRVCHPLARRLSDARMVDAFPSLLPTDRSGIPILQSVTSASINCWQDFDVALKGTVGGAKVSLKVVGSKCDDGSFYLDAALREFRLLFAGAPIKQLEISGDLDTVSSIDDHLSFLDGFPALQTIDVTAQGSPLTFLLALARPSPFLPSDASDSSEPSGAGSDEQSSECIVCPELRSLTLAYVDWQQGLIEALVTVLRRRIDHGLPKLENLALTLSTSKAGPPEEVGEQLEDTLGVYEEELKSLTGNFEWWTAD